MKYNNILEDSEVRLFWWCVSDTVLGSKYAEVSVTHPIKRSHADLSEEKRAASWLCHLPHQHHCHVLVMLLLAWQNESKAKDTTVAQVLQQELPRMSSVHHGHGSTLLCCQGWEKIVSFWTYRKNRGKRDHKSILQDTWVQNLLPAFPPPSLHGV